MKEDLPPFEVEIQPLTFAEPDDCHWDHECDANRSSECSAYAKYCRGNPIFTFEHGKAHK